MPYYKPCLPLLILLTPYFNCIIRIDSPLNSPRVSRKVISAPTRPTSLIIPQLYTVIQVEVKDQIGANLRVPENLMEVYGFNITYEIIDIADRTRLDDDPKVSEPCMKHQCRYYEHEIICISQLKKKIHSYYSSVGGGGKLAKDVETLSLISDVEWLTSTFDVLTTSHTFRIVSAITECVERTRI